MMRTLGIKFVVICGIGFLVSHAVFGFFSGVTILFFFAFGVSAVTYILSKCRCPQPILFGFLIFGLLMGCWSWSSGPSDTGFVIGFPESEISERVYNDYLLPYWERTLEPVGYEQFPIIDLETGEIVGVENVPVYDFPLKSSMDLYIPFAALFWGLLGLVVQLSYKLLTKW